MAIQSASAKLYTGIRCWVVDKNISAALTSSFSLGNRNRPASGGDTVFANVLVFKLQRAIADLVMTPSVSLTNERYKTYGGGNNVITPGASRVIDNTNNWKVNLSVVCKFPTYFRIDVDKLDLPQGTTCTVSFEEDWIRDGVYLESTKASSAAIGNFFTFRTPWKGASFINSTFTLPNRTALRIKQLASSVSSTATVIARGIYNPGKFAALFAGTFSTISFATKNTGILFVQAPYQIISTMITNGVRAKLFNCNINSDSGVSIITLGSRVRKTPADLFLYTNVSSAGTRSASLVPTSISSNFTMNATPVKEVKTITTEAMTSSLTCKITLVVSSVTSNITATSTFEQNSDLVFTYYGQNFVGAPFGNAYNEGQFTSNATIFWGDGTSEIVGNTGPARSHAYPSLQEWTIRVRVPAGSVLKGFNAIDVNTAATNAGQCVRKIKTFGQIGIINLVQFGTNQFESAWIEELPDALPPTVRKLDNAFGNTQWYFNWKGARIVGGISLPAKDHNLIGKRIQNWDVSKVTSFSNCFRDSAFGDGSGNKITYDEMDLRLWNTESATNMTGMFNRTDINQDLSGWCVPLIASTPSSFYVQSTTVNPLFQPPVWGTCP
jgi:hypothetical protein